MVISGYNFHRHLCFVFVFVGLVYCPGSSGVEQRTENPRVGGSIPPPGTIKEIE